MGMKRNDGPYEACHTSKDTEPYAYSVSGPGNGIGYYCWVLYPKNTFASFEEAEKAARLMNLAFREGQAERSRQIKDLLG